MGEAVGESAGDTPDEPADGQARSVCFERVVKVFGGVRAVDDVSFVCRAGEIVALLGENGAGKSTLIKMLAGVYRRDGGRITFDGTDVDEPHGRDGLAFIHQDLGLIEWMTVAENMGLGYGFGGRSHLVPFSKRNLDERAAAALEVIGGGIDPQTRVFDLTRTEKSLLAVARALAMNARFLVLDEPTASLPHDDVAALFSVLRQLRHRGVGMIYVSHRLDEVFQIADRVAVMRNARLVGHLNVGDVTPTALVGLIVGHELDRVQVAPAPPIDAVTRVELDAVCIGDVGPINLSVKAGEIVGLVGLRGAGQATVGRAVAGVETVTSGQVTIDGQPCNFQSARAAASRGVSFATSNRESEGLVNGLCVRENIFVNPRLWGRPLLRWRSRRDERQRARDVMIRFGIRPADTEKMADTLSGGNQQKMILARWIGIRRTALVLEEPTMGVDVGAKADIYSLLGGIVAQGTSVLIVSTDFEEVATICHRAIVFSRGQSVSEMGRDDMSIANLLAAASSTTTGPTTGEEAA